MIKKINKVLKELSASGHMKEIDKIEIWPSGKAICYQRPYDTMTLEQLHNLAKTYKDFNDFNNVIKSHITSQPTTVEVKGDVIIEFTLIQ